MSVGTGIGVAMLIGAGVSAGTSIYNANKQSNAAKDANAQQQASGLQARAATDPLYQQALQIAQQQAAQGQARLDPYAQQGGAGLTALSAFLGVPQPSASANAARSAALSPYAPLPAPSAAQQAASQQVQADANNATQAAMGLRPMNVYGPSGLIGPGQPNGLPLQTPAQAAAQRQAMNAPAAQGGGGDVVMMRSPGGQIGRVPRARVAEAIAAGGQVVG